MTPNDIMQAARDVTNITDTSYITNAMMRRWLNDALQIASHEAKIVENKDTTLTTTADTADYTIPSNIFSLKWVEVNGEPVDLINFEEKELVQIDSVTVTSGKPRWALHWGRTITFVPAPDTTGQTITIYSYKTHPEIVSADDASTTIILAESAFHSYFVDYVAYRMTLKEGTGRHIPFQQLWELNLERMKRKMDSRRRGQRFQVQRSVERTIRSVV